jgi:hypothetical protein
MVSESQKRSARKYQKNNTKLISVRVNKKLEPEVLEWLESKPSMGGYILELIREDMEKHIESEEYL